MHLLQALRDHVDLDIELRAHKETNGSDGALEGGIVGGGRAQDGVAPRASAVVAEPKVLGEPAELEALAAVGFGVRKGAAPLGDGEAGGEVGNGEEVGDVGLVSRQGLAGGRGR
jgi:hypothetical protein